MKSIFPDLVKNGNFVICAQKIKTIIKLFNINIIIINRSYLKGIEPQIQHKELIILLFEKKNQEKLSDRAFIEFETLLFPTYLFNCI